MNKQNFSQRINELEIIIANIEEQKASSSSPNFKAKADRQIFNAKAIKEINEMLLKKTKEAMKK